MSATFLSRFQLYQPVVPIKFDATHLTNLKSSAVLIPLLLENNELSILFCKRPQHLTHHPGQICFPGGKQDPCDGSLSETALREAEEELGINQNSVDILGQLPGHAMLTGFNIKPFVGLLKNDAELTINRNEVADIFTLPLAVLQQEQNWQKFEFKLRGEARLFNGFSTNKGLIWGATAEILRNLLKQVAI